MTTKKFVFVSLLLFLAGCSLSADSPATTTVFPGKDCNNDLYIENTELLFSYLDQSTMYSGGTKLTVLENVDSHLSYIDEFRSLVYSLDVTGISKKNLLAAIDQYVKDVYYYFSYNQYSNAVLRINTSNAKMYSAFDMFRIDYEKLCYTILSPIQQIDF